MDRRLYHLAAVAGFLGVALGAFAAHGLKARLTPDMLAVFETGVRYQMYHVFALFAAAWGFARWQHRAFVVGGWLFVAGIVIFCGSLYALALSGRAMVRRAHARGWPGIPRPAGSVSRGGRPLNCVHDFLRLLRRRSRRHAARLRERPGAMPLRDRGRAGATAHRSLSLPLSGTHDRDPPASLRRATRGPARRTKCVFEVDEIHGTIPSHWVHATNAMFATAYHRTVIFECDAAVSEDPKCWPRSSSGSWPTISRMAGTSR